MKIIHAADLHLGSRLTSLPTGKIKNEIKNEVLNRFDHLVEYAKNNLINLIMLSGDVFDSDRPSKKDKDYFYNLIKANKDITFLYLKGNHDIDESVVQESENLLVFNESWTSYEFDNIVISGIELSSSNSNSLYNLLDLDSTKFNIVMMHGDISSKGKDGIDLKKLASKNIDYLALGHIHAYGETTIDSRGIAIYPGSLSGRGFDECGEKGFVVLDIENNKCAHEFVTLDSNRKFLKVKIDLSNKNNLVEATEQIKEEIKDIDNDYLVELELYGRVNFDIEGVEEHFLNAFNAQFFYLRIKNLLKQNIDIKKYENDCSLRGEFVRTVFNDQNISEDDKTEILNIGIKLFNGEDIQ